MAEPSDRMVSALNLDKKCPSLDIVSLLNAAGGMDSCIHALARNITTFIDILNAPDLNGGRKIKDWRIRVVEYRDRDFDGGDWSVDNQFSTGAEEVKSQLASLRVVNDEDETEYLLDAMYSISQWSSAEKGAHPTTYCWRHRHDAARFVFIFTNASCKNTFTASDGSVGTVDDLIHAYHAAKLKVILFAPDAPVYADLSAMDGLEWEPVGVADGTPTQSLAEFIDDTNNFRKVMELGICEAFRAKAIYRPVIL